MPDIPTVDITVADNGINTVLTLPINKVQFVLGVALAGVLYQPVATASPATVLSTFQGGPLAESAGLVTNAGGIVVAMRIPTASTGTAKTPQTVGTGTALGSVAVTLDGTNGAFDDYFVALRCTKGGTLSNSGSSGIQFQISLDAGRNWSPLITLAANALTYVIPGTGITLTLGTNGQTYVLGDTIQFQTIAPIWNDGGIQNGFLAFKASQYALAGVGSMHLVGPVSSGDITDLELYLDDLFARFVFSRCITELRDAAAPTVWGGSGESEASWINSLALSVSATTARRVLASGGHYNTPSAYPNATYGTVFSYRRPAAWSEAVRRVQVPPQRRAGRVKDGALTNITVDPTKDPADGFIYHDEAVNPGLNAARLLSLMTWPKKQGFFVCQENLLAPSGSQINELVLGNVIDIACDIGYETGVEEVSDDLRYNPDGQTLYTNDRLDIESEITGALKTNMTDQAMVTSASASIDPTAPVKATGKIPIKISVTPRFYVNAIEETIGLDLEGAAPTAGG